MKGYITINVHTNINELLQKAEKLKELLKEAKAIESELASSKILIELEEK